MVASGLAGLASCGRTPVFPPCDPPKLLCGEECRDLMEDPLACGGCDRSCGVNQACVAGVCKVFCPQGATLCDGKCVHLPTDNANCGQCGLACPTGQPCVAGKCAAACPAGLTRCGDQCVNLKNDRENCSACGQKCNQYLCYYCIDGFCSQTSGVFECQTGACTDTGTNPKHCGGCGRSCDAGQVCDYDPASGYLGNCFAQCTPGRTSCDGTCTDLKTDSRNCGGCGITCPACTICSNGQCSANAGVLRCGRSCDSLRLWPGTGFCGPCGTTCDASGLACQRCR